MVLGVLELFRASINQAVISAFKNDTLEMSDFSSRGGVYLKYEGRKKVWGAFVALVDALSPKLNAEIATLKKMMVA